MDSRLTLTIPEEPTPKALAACELLNWSLRAYFEKAYFASLHMAGAAEEIFGGYVERYGGQNAFNNMHAGAMRIAARLDPEREPSHPNKMKGLMNYARNRVKHLDEEGDDEIQFDPEIQARDVIDRAINDYYQLSIVWLLPAIDAIEKYDRKVVSSQVVIEPWEDDKDH